MHKKLQRKSTKLKRRLLPVAKKTKVGAEWFCKENHRLRYYCLYDGKREFVFTNNGTNQLLFLNTKVHVVAQFPIPKRQPLPRERKE
jgi:hypothetical protein